MATVLTYTVVPKLPPKIARLSDIANNFCWCWDPEAIDLFFRIDRDLWLEIAQNPVLLLGRVSQDRLEALAQDDSFLAHLDRVWKRTHDYLTVNPWRDRNPSAPQDVLAAYLSAEYGIHESLGVYSGGLGVLAGDFLKSVSDIGLPLVAIGLLYREGYFRQYLNADGWQQERYPKNDFYNLPVSLVRDDQGQPIVFGVPYPDGELSVRIWQCNVGRVPLYLLDSDFEANDPDDREITARLYGGDRDMRIRQEILLGMGGVRALRAMGLYPSVYHMNEGHAAFLTLERIAALMTQEKLTFPHAVESVKEASVFTTHTPVPAGNDMFSPEMIEHYFGAYCRDLGIPMNDLLALGRQNPADAREPFCMTVLALRLSAGANGVSKLHGHVARTMWERTWPGVPDDEIPITSITNGVHTRFWISRDLASLYDRYIGPSWIATPADGEVWKRIDSVPDAELWRTHERRRERLVDFARYRLAKQLRDRGAPQAEIAAAAEVLDPEALTIGFARRFATYKRATLFMSDPERLVRLLTDAKRPVQMIIAGKAHPQDNQGKDLIRDIIHFVRKYGVRNHLVFIEDYDINVSRYMVQGVDCWLNTPRRPMEASGTSGMKAASNGVLNISISDGWWCEAEGLSENGWTIGRGEVYDNPDEQDVLESETLYEILEREAVPIFYERGRDGIPREWVQRMKNAIRTICPVFNTHRMAQEYADRFYLPCTFRRNELRANERKRSKALTVWKQKVRAAWDKVHFTHIESGPTEGLPFGSSLTVTADLALDGLKPDDVTVEIYHGDVDSYNRIIKGRADRMELVETVADNVYRFRGGILCDKTGQQGFTVRVIPHHADLMEKHETGLITWG
ncbi:MAG TPA: alpha-glucan family phosphorylase [Candidatus Hydrogenedentes bacterium]|nr:alpha-glucan family phosphorylase [Candidatus Hydrogenedentota bacterium]HOS03365.1 alpha-glucan family phosphorylase [Candidatus Hydrogenedentota bacterium]